MNAIKDLFDRKILKYTILPFVLDLIFWFVVFFFFSNEIISFFIFLLNHLPFGEKFSEIVGHISGFVLIIIFYYLAVISTLGIFSSFFIDKIVLRINEKHFNSPLKNSSLKDTFYGVLVSIKAFLIYLIVLIFTFYLYFIPIVNIFYHLFLMSILNKKPLVFDSSYLFANPKEIEKKYNFSIWIRVYFTSFIYFIPFISLFGYTFQLIFITHFILKNLKENNDLQSHTS